MVGTLSIDPRRPLIICDADEVLVQFMMGLERYLERQGYRLDLTSFRIHGNVRHTASGDTVKDEDVTQLIGSFFASDTAILDPVPGAAAALRRLSSHAQVVVLSNLPDTAREARIENLTSHGMAYPVIAGSGPKGSVVARMIGDMKAPVVFIDDLPPHHASVAATTPRVHRLHFVADPRLARLIGASPDAHARIDSWPEAEAWIGSRLGAG
jgi:hypothetical protein